jgi:hypothetical protein
MERKIMSKTNDTSKLASRDRELRDDELDAVSGGIIAILIGLLNRRGFVGGHLV